MDPVKIYKDLLTSLKPLTFRPPVSVVYNPLTYAWRPFEQYLRRYGTGHKEVVLLGMNPGPWGMAQTGVPFGEVGIVRHWLKIDGRVTKPDIEHPKRPIQGFACQRSEVSGARLWGWAKDTFHTPQRFFSRFFVANYCPLAFMEESGRNFTPDKLPAAERAQVERVCDEALQRLVNYWKPRHVIGVGAFAAQRARGALKGFDVTVGEILHPSPASPAANRGWAKAAKAQLLKQNIRLP